MESQLILILMKDYGLQGSEQKVWGLFIGTRFYIQEQLWSCELIEV